MNCAYPFFQHIVWYGLWCLLVLCCAWAEGYYNLVAYDMSHCTIKFYLEPAFSMTLHVSMLQVIIPGNSTCSGSIVFFLNMEYVTTIIVSVMSIVVLVAALTVVPISAAQSILATLWLFHRLPWFCQWFHPHVQSKLLPWWYTTLGIQCPLELSYYKGILPPNVFHIGLLLYAVIAAPLHVYLYTIIGEAFQVSILYWLEYYFFWLSFIFTLISAMQLLRCCVLY